MKPANLIIAFVIIMLPFFLINNHNSKLTKQNNILKQKYDYILESAVDDASHILVSNNKHELDNPLGLSLDKEKAVATFYNSLHINFNLIDDNVGREVLDMHIPIILVVDYDGFYIYAYEEYDDGSNTILKRVWSEKKYYTHIVEDYVLSFTLGDDITVYDKSTFMFYEGNYEDIGNQLNITILKDPDLYSQVKGTTITTQIQQVLEFYVNQHNEYAKKNGITYKFLIPALDNEYYNTVNDIGILAFLQGIPLMKGYYNNSAFGGSKVLQGPVYVAGEYNGIKYYHRESCSIYNLSTDETKTSFHDRLSAAENGYIPCPKCKP